MLVALRRRAAREARLRLLVVGSRGLHQLALEARDRARRHEPEARRALLRLDLGARDPGALGRPESRDDVAVAGHPNLAEVRSLAGTGEAGEARARTGLCAQDLDLALRV